MLPFTLVLIHMQLRTFKWAIPLPSFPTPASWPGVNTGEKVTCVNALLVSVWENIVKEKKSQALYTPWWRRNYLLNAAHLELSRRRESVRACGCDGRVRERFNQCVPHSEFVSRESVPHVHMLMDMPKRACHVPFVPNNRSRDQAIVDHMILSDSTCVVM